MTNHPHPLAGAVKPLTERKESLVWIIENTTQVRIRDLALDLLQSLSAPTPPADVAGLVERAEAAEAALADARDKALEEAAKVAQGQYREVSMLDHESPSYGIDMTPDRSDWGRGIQRGREQAAAAIRKLKKGPSHD